ncbi:MAG TPA: MBL fold metallo-hydrolase [Polyangia bacterium]|jgi:phosphoribosyl 1,2-cyclic phosphodiesterase/DNA-binding response OmpR family regulator|nr:MBL fold metallo-hydrolase [Polyangia bacterium]
MRIEFWGTRGSIAKPGPNTVRYGGNTSCVAIYPKGGARIILDCGTGAHGLGQSLMASGEKPIRGHLLIGHTHWDHIQGLPFFTPVFVPGNEWDIYAPRGLRTQLRETLAGQMEYTYFPVSLEQLGATIRYHDLIEGTFHIGPVSIRTQYLNHPAITLGYRLEADGVVVVYATDHEPHGRPPTLGDTLVRRPLLHAEDRRHADFFAGADLLIHDAQYTSAEYASKIGWGHSTIDYVIEMALAAGVKRLALFHHDPLRTDDAIDALVDKARVLLSQAGEAMELFAAAEGQSLELTGPAKDAMTANDAARRSPELRSAVAERNILIVTADAALAQLLRGALEFDGFKIVLSSDTRTALAQAEALRPALVITSRRSPEGEGPQLDGIEITRRLRAHSDLTLRDAPVVIMADATDGGEVPAGFDAGATDWLTLPISAAFIQSRMRSWLLRTRVRWNKPPLPPNEKERLAVLRSMNVLDTPREERFDRLTRLAARSMNSSYAYLSLVEEDRLWFKSTVNSESTGEPRDIAMCSYVILANDLLVVPDATIDPEYGDNPSFHNERHLRFYAGVPVRGRGGLAVGTLCVYDARPRHPSADELGSLKDIAALVEEELQRPS